MSGCAKRAVVASLIVGSTQVEAMAVHPKGSNDQEMKAAKKDSKPSLQDCADILNKVTKADGKPLFNPPLKPDLKDLRKLENQATGKAIQDYYLREYGMLNAPTHVTNDLLHTCMGAIDAAEAKSGAVSQKGGVTMMGVIFGGLAVLFF